ncbi:MAG: YraN family protein [Micrococcaceae bacterium]|nr:YraN family protein [Micrococcaceae bacterium]
MNHNQELGAAGEELAANFLLAAGYTVLERNWRCDLGELDIVARHAGQLVGVEVKTRTSLGFGHPAESVNAAKLRRLSRLIRCWSRTHGYSGQPVRVDVLAILAPPGGEPLIEHLIGVES